MEWRRNLIFAVNFVVKKIGHLSSIHLQRFTTRYLPHLKLCWNRAPGKNDQICDILMINFRAVWPRCVCRFIYFFWYNYFPYNIDFNKKIIWFYQLSWQCKLAIVKRFENWRFERWPFVGANRFDEGLRLETSAFDSLYGGQFTLSTQLIKPDYLVILPPTQHHSFCRNLPPLFFNKKLYSLNYQ